MTNRCKGKEFSAFIRQHVMLSTFGGQQSANFIVHPHHVHFGLTPKVFRPSTGLKEKRLHVGSRRSAISDKFAKLHNKVTFKVFPALMKTTAPHLFISSQALEERFFFVGGARANALACPMFTLFPSAPDTHTYNLNFSNLP